MLCLVTGATGFVGRHLVEALAKRGHAVRALVRPARMGTASLPAGVEASWGDLNDRASLDAALAGVDIVYNCAGYVSDWGELAAFRKANVEGLGSLLSACEERPLKRFLHVSTTDVYGYPGEPVDEEAPFRRRGYNYTDTKIEGEELAWRSFRARGLPLTVVRPVSIYGPGSQTLVLDIVEQIRLGAMVHLGPRSTIAGLCQVSNLVDAMILAAESERSIGQAYNVSDGSAVTWVEYVNALADSIGAKRPGLVLPRPVAYAAGWAMERLAAGKAKRPLLTRMAVDIFTTHQSFSIAKARRELGYEPKIEFAAGIAGVKDWIASLA